MLFGSERKVVYFQWATLFIVIPVLVGWANIRYCGNALSVNSAATEDQLLHVV